MMHPANRWLKNSCDTQKVLQCMSIFLGFTNPFYSRLFIHILIDIEDYSFTGYQYPYGYKVLFAYLLSFVCVGQQIHGLIAFRFPHRTLL